MIKSYNEKNVEIKNMRGGKGECKIVNHINPEELPHGRLFSTITIDSGNSIGSHEHHNEVEYYLILSGQGVVTESSGEHIVKEGDVVITGWGEGHAIRNDEAEPLVFLALILFTD
ncbi:MAG: cupin domain-containing protein [Spirochaetia bacterium]|nr:cupin domain-containing protein [Spirochaetia bacterium]